MAESSIKKLCPTNNGRKIENHLDEEWTELAGIGASEWFYHQEFM
jgi:hypothetical protein